MKLKEKSILVIFGSGGHTTEMLLMLQNTNIFEKYGHVHFVFGHSDSWSLQKVQTHYKSSMGIDIHQEVKKGNLTLHKLFRAREVKQSYLTSVVTTIIALCHSVVLIAKVQFQSLDLILTNGPGTAVPICYIYWFISKVLMFNLNSKIIFVESFCRVQSLSFTGKLLKPILSKFVVQHKQLQKKVEGSICFDQKIL